MSDMSLMVADAVAAALAAAGITPPPVAPVATPDTGGDDLDALLAAYAVYKARVTRGTPRTFEEWTAARRSRGKLPVAPAAPAPVAGPVLSDGQVPGSDGEAAQRMLKRGDCVAVLKLPGGNLAGVYRYPGKKQTGRVGIAGDDPTGDTYRWLMDLLAGYVIATR